MVHVKIVNKIISEKLHKNGVLFPEDRNVSLLDHQHGCHDVTCKPEIIGRENIIHILYISRLAEKRLKLGCHKNVQQLVTCLSTLFFTSWYLKLSMKLCVLEASPPICPLANEAMG